MAVQQQLSDLSTEVTQLRREAASIANATENTLDELLQHMEELQKLQAGKSQNPEEVSKKKNILIDRTFIEQMPSLSPKLRRCRAHPSVPLVAPFAATGPKCPRLGDREERNLKASS